ncbi:MAG: serine hydrolase [Anaerolineae bacterium]|jgi:CubicO group peptidase (beta-lactamase class C family)
MLIRQKVFTLILLGSLLITGCRSVEPTDTPLPATATQVAVAVTDTPLPPTAVAALPTVPPVSSVGTEAEPSATPTESSPVPNAAPTTRPGYFSRDELMEDARQLAEAIESAHPDPYINGGGKIAFHHRLQRLLNAIPEGGMTREEFIVLLRPFIAAVGDAHTELWSDYSVNDYTPGGVPLRFGIVEESLYVAGVPDQEYEDLIGSLLVSVEGVPLAELNERQRRLQGTENQYHVLYLLANLSLWYKPHMEELLPEWQDSRRVRVELQLSGGEIREVVFDLPKGTEAMFTPESQVTLPATDDSGFHYEFLGTSGKTAYLRIDQMSHYREATEMETSKAAPHLRSATETFRSMVVEMEQAGTDTLIIDLRDNRGGNSVMGDILTYFLYGKEALRDIVLHPDSIGGGMVRKYSDLFWEQTQSWTSLEQVNEGRVLPLRADDYDFAAYSGDGDQSSARKAEAIAYHEKSWLARSPTFWEEYQSRAYSGYYCPGNVVVLIDSETFSSGFTMARYLYLAGATFVGTPSGQAANSFGNGQLWHLDHTGIEGTVSTTYSVMFPDDSELARVLPVHYPLTYERLASYNFDPNAEYLYALELLSEHGELFGLSAKLDREIERVFRQSDTPGLAVGVVIDQELVYAKGFGVVNLETGGEVTPRTLFHMASVTKPFVATSIVQLLEQKKLSLDDPIVKHLPYFEMRDRRYPMLTIRQFVTHSSGMPDVEDYGWDEPEYDEGALERYVRSLGDRMLVSVPGEGFIYSNMAFEVLGDLIAKVSGQSFADYVKEHILLPLDMNDSSILIQDVDPALLANGYVQEEGGTIRATDHYAYNRAHGPSSCLYSNVVDMSRWAIANMNGGELEDRRILDASSYELLWTPEVEVGTRDGRPRHIGLSWFLSEHAGHQTVSHGGRDIGYQTNFVMVPDAGVAVIVLSNYFGPDTIVNEVTDLALELALGSE